MYLGATLQNLKFMVECFSEEIMSKRFVKCPSCSAAMGLREDKIGQKIKCPKCSGVFASSWKRKPLHMRLKDSANKLGWVACGILLMFIIGRINTNPIGASQNTQGIPVSFSGNNFENLFQFPVFKPKVNLQNILPAPSLNEENNIDDINYDRFFKNDEFDNDQLNWQKGKLPVAEAVWKNKIPVVEIGWRRRRCQNVCPNVCPNTTALVTKTEEAEWRLLGDKYYYKYVFPSNMAIDSKFEEDVVYSARNYKVWVFNGLAPRISDYTRDGTRYVSYDYTNGIDIAKCQVVNKTILAKAPEEITGVDTSEASETIVTPVKTKLKKPSEFPVDK